MRFGVSCHRPTLSLTSSTACHCSMYCPTLRFIRKRLKVDSTTFSTTKKHSLQLNKQTFHNLPLMQQSQLQQYTGWHAPCRVDSIQRHTGAGTLMCWLLRSWLRWAGKYTTRCYDGTVPSDPMQIANTSSSDVIGWWRVDDAGEAFGNFKATPSQAVVCTTVLTSVTSWSPPYRQDKKHAKN